MLESDHRWSSFEIKEGGNFTFLFLQEGGGGCNFVFLSSKSLEKSNFFNCLKGGSRVLWVDPAWPSMNLIYTIFFEIIYSIEIKITYFDNSYFIVIAQWILFSYRVHILLGERKVLINNIYNNCNFKNEWIAHQTITLCQIIHWIADEIVIIIYFHNSTAAQTFLARGRNFSKKHKNHSVACLLLFYWSGICHEWLLTWSKVKTRCPHAMWTLRSSMNKFFDTESSFETDVIHWTIYSSFLYFASQAQNCYLLNRKIPFESWLYIYETLTIYWTGKLFSIKLKIGILIDAILDSPFFLNWI